MNLALTADAAAQQLDLADYPDQGLVGQVLILQNLGPGDVYFDRADDVDETTGVKVATDGFYEFELRHVLDLYFMANGGDSDLRFSVVG